MIIMVWGTFSQNLWSKNFVDSWSESLPVSCPAYKLKALKNNLICKSYSYFATFTHSETQRSQLGIAIPDQFY